MSAIVGDLPRWSYLREGHTIRSWLLSTDHKRIAILYLVTITLFFFIGSVAAGLVRLELITPPGDLLTHDGYNKAFTLHGVIMVWFFLIPSIPTTFGNFLIPLMLGARDLAFPKLNLASWLRSAAHSPSMRCSPAASTPAGRSIRPTARSSRTPT